MSHFSTVVIFNNGTTMENGPKALEEAMAPFMENCCGTPEKRFMEFYDIEDENRETYEKEGIEKVVLPSGELVLPWDERFKPKPTKDDPFPRAEAPKELKRRMVPFKERYSTFEEFMEEWCGHKSRDDVYNRYGYWQNPNAKWDWYEIGGRWSGFFQLKKGYIGGFGKQYNFSGKIDESKPGGRADVCFKQSIDFEAMRKQNGESAGKRYDLVHKAIKGTPEAESWEMVRLGFDLKEPGAIDEARKRYHDQPRVKAFQKFAGSDEGRETIGWMAGVEEYQFSREEYLQQARNHAAVPFAVIKDGKWYELGSMGWFGVSTDEKDPETWNSMVQKMYDELPGTALLINVDCHI